MEKKDLYTLIAVGILGVIWIIKIIQRNLSRITDEEMYVWLFYATALFLVYSYITSFLIGGNKKESGNEEEFSDNNEFENANHKL